MLVSSAVTIGHRRFQQGFATVNLHCPTRVLGSYSMIIPLCRGLHSSTVRLNVSAFCGIGGANRGCLGGVWEV